MRYRLLPHCLLPALLSACGILLFSAPVQAGRLQSWQFSASDNRLTLSTDERVQPRVQLVPNPTRLVIDLPGTTLGRSQVSQSIDGNVREVRVGQFNAETTRIVIEFEAGYTIDPNQVQVTGSSAASWTVQLPTLEASQADNAVTEPLPIPVIGSPSRLAAPTQTQAQAQVDADTTLEAVRATQDGFFFRTSGKTPDIQQQYSDDRRQLVLELQNTAISPRLSQRDIAVDRYGIQQIQLAQIDNENSPRVRITLNLAEDSPNWQASATNLGGVVLVPAGGIAAALPNDRRSQSLTSRTELQQSTAQEQPSTPSSMPDGSIELPDIGDRRVRIAIDPGHGGRDPGAVGIDGLQEKGVVLDISLQVAELLEQQGAQVILTRRNDSEIDLEPRVRDANQGNATLFVSIHANAISLERPDINGVETYYYSSDAGYQLAQAIQASVAQGTGMRNIGVKQARFYILRNTQMPAALVEVGFVTGRDDAPRLADAQFRTRMAQAITRGILQYVQQHL